MQIFQQVGVIICKDMSWGENAKILEDMQDSYGRYKKNSALL